MLQPVVTCGAFNSLISTMDQHFLTPLFEPQSIALFTGPQDVPDEQTPPARALLTYLAE